MTRIDLETQLVAYSLQDDRGYAEAMTLGVTPTLFTNEALRAIWSLIGANVALEDMPSALMSIDGGMTTFIQVTSEVYRQSQAHALAKHTAQELVTMDERAWVLEQMRHMENAIAKGEPMQVIGKITNDISARLLDKQRKRPKSRYQVCLEYLKEKKEGKRGPVKMGFGIPIQDEFLSNILPGELIIVAGRSGEGKTAWALQLAQETAKRGTPVQFITGEMQDKELYCRMDSQELGISGKTLRGATLPEIVEARIRENNEHWRDRKLDIEPMGDERTGDDIVNCIKRAFLSGVQVVVIDYVGLVSGGKFRSRHEEMADLSRRLKLVASSTGGVVVALAQLNRNAVQDKKQGDLNLSHLAESDQFGRDSELVFMLSKKDDGSGHTTVFIAKNRHGQTGKFALQYDGETTKFIGEIPIYNENDSSDDLIY
jgi:replicative DNA helicase